MTVRRCLRKGRKFYWCQFLRTSVVCRVIAIVDEPHNEDVRNSSGSEAKRGSDHLLSSSNVSCQERALQMPGFALTMLMDKVRKNCIVAL